jgi:SAM-dependent methyltransferase
MTSGRDPDATARIRRHRALWADVNDQFTGVDAVGRWSEPSVSWGLFRHPESDLGALGPVAGLPVLDLGCGTGYLGAWLARAGAAVVALDLSPDQLDTARRCQHEIGPSFPLVEADGEDLPFADGSFELVVSEYGVAPWCDPARWVPEAARVLRPDGRLVFLTNSPLAAMTVPEEGGPAGDRLLRGPGDLRVVSWPGGGREHHPGHGEWIELLTRAGFRVEGLRELVPPDVATDPEFYEIVTADWGRRWPAEDLWSARLIRAGDR